MTPTAAADASLPASHPSAGHLLRTAAHVRTRAPGMPYAHPTVEHSTPLFVTLGAATDPSAPVTTTVGGSFMGLAKRSFEAA